MVIADGPMWTDQVQALATAFGALAVVVAGLALGRDVSVRRKEQRDADAAQARLVTCRFRRGVAKDMNGPYITSSVHNDSGFPMHQVSLSVAARAIPGHRELVRAWDYIEPRSHLDAEWRSGPIDVYQTPGTSLPAWMLVVEFTDAAGLVWERVDNGPPRRVIEGTPRRVPLVHRLGAWLQRL